MTENELSAIQAKTEEDAPDQGRRRSILRLNNVFDFIELLVVTVAVILLLASFTVRHTVVDGGSMNETLANGEHLLISDVAYVPQNGDIVVFQPLTTYRIDGKPFIKRVIAVEGQTVEIRSGTVFVDGVALADSYVTLEKGGSIYPETVVPEGYVFVLGDNRRNSRDSRDPTVGMVDVRSILGKVICRVWPISKFGEVE